MKTDPSGLRTDLPSGDSGFGTEAFGIEEAQDKTLAFADSDKIPAWSRGYIKKAVELGIIKGYSDNTFGPQREITRAEVVTIISKCIQLKGR